MTKKLAMLRALSLILILFCIPSTKNAAASCANLLAQRAGDHENTPLGTLRVESILGIDTLVTDSSAHVRERAMKHLKVFQIKDILSDSGNQVLMGFGKPNVYLIVPEVNSSGHSKYAAKSLKRGKSQIEGPDLNRGFAQSGIILRFNNLSAEALSALRESMKKHEGERSWTCVNSNCRVLSDAGFTSGEKSLTSHYFPIHLLRSLLQNGLKYKSKDIAFDVIRTTPANLERFSISIISSELSTMYRHADRAYGQTTTGKVAHVFFAIPKKFFKGSLFLLFGREDKTLEEIATPFPNEIPSDSNFSLEVSTPTQIGVLLRLLWGPHRLYEVTQDHVNVDDYLPEKLKAFLQEKPSFLTRLKKQFLFSKPVISLIRSQLANGYLKYDNMGTREFFNALRTHSDSFPNKYNIVIAGNRIVVAKIGIRHKAVDWLLTKHVLMSGYEKNVRFAGETWKTPDGRIHINNNSGTYKPKEAQLQRAVSYLTQLFSSVEIVAESH